MVKSEPHPQLGLSLSGKVVEEFRMKFNNYTLDNVLNVLLKHNLAHTNIN